MQIDGAPKETGHVPDSVMDCEYLSCAVWPSNPDLTAFHSSRDARPFEGLLELNRHNIFVVHCFRIRC